MNHLTFLFAASLIFSTPALAADKVTFGTDWRAQAEHGGFYQALADGLYAANGLEVTLRQGGPQVNHAQLLAAGRLDFAMAPNSFIPLNFAAQNIPMLAVAAMFQKDPAVLIAHAGVGNDSLADLASKKRKIMIGPDTRIGFWRFLKSKYAFTDDQIAPYTFNIAPFLADKLAVQQGYLSSEPFQIERIGITPNVFLLADSGYASYAAIITTSRKLTESNPDLVRRFIDASVKGWTVYLTGDPKPADGLIKKDNPEMTDELLAYGREKMRSYGIVESGDAKAGGIGVMTDTRWKEFFDVMAADGLYPRGMDYKNPIRCPSSAAKPYPVSNLLTLSGVAQTFPNGTQALAPTDLSVTEGSFVSLVGPSGCGKSTLLRIASGLLAPTHGRVLRNFSAAPGEIGFVFQDPTLMPWANVADNVRLPLDLSATPSADAEQKVTDALARVGLSEFAAAYPRQLSGGMKMRASIARAIVTNPRVLLMDEPFAALDEFTRFKLNDDLLRLWQANRWTVMFVTHSVREAVFMSERIIVMTPRPGRIAADLRVGLPVQRDAEMRLGHAFADETATVTRALESVMATT